MEYVYLDQFLLKNLMMSNCMISSCAYRYVYVFVCIVSGDGAESAPSPRAPDVSDWIVYNQWGAPGTDLGIGPPKVG